MEWTPRLVGVIVALVVALSAVVMFRSRQTPTADFRPVPGSIGARSAKKGHKTSPGSNFGSTRSRSSSSDLPRRPLPPHRFEPSEGGDPRPRDLASTGENTAASEEGRRLAAEPIPPRVLNSGAGGFSAGELDRGAGVADEDKVAELPEGTALAIPLQGSSEGVDATLPIIDENVYYDAPGGAYFAPDARLAYANRGGVKNDAGSIAFWIKPSWTGNEPTDASFIQLRTHSWDNRMHVFKNGVFLRFLIADDNGIEHNVGASIASWGPDQWHHVAVTWGESARQEGESVTSLFLDTGLIEQNNFVGAMAIPDGTPLYVGSDSTGGAPGANAVISSLQVMEYAMTPEEIANLAFSTQPKE